MRSTCTFIFLLIIQPKQIGEKVKNKIFVLQMIINLLCVPIELLIFIFFFLFVTQIEFPAIHWLWPIHRRLFYWVDLRFFFSFLFFREFVLASTSMWLLLICFKWTRKTILWSDKKIKNKIKILLYVNAVVFVLYLKRGTKQCILLCIWYEMHLKLFWIWRRITIIRP